jgi:hypothetical protein
MTRLLGEPPPPLQVIRARPVFILYTDMNGQTKWRRVSPIEIKWTEGEGARLEPGYVMRVFDHDLHKMCSFVPERIKKWEQEK